MDRWKRFFRDADSVGFDRMVGGRNRFHRSLTLEFAGVENRCLTCAVVRPPVSLFLPETRPSSWLRRRLRRIRCHPCSQPSDARETPTRLLLLFPSYSPFLYSSALSFTAWYSPRYHAFSFLHSSRCSARYVSLYSFEY